MIEDRQTFNKNFDKRIDSILNIQSDVRNEANKIKENSDHDRLLADQALLELTINQFKILDERNFENSTLDPQLTFAKQDAERNIKSLASRKEILIKKREAVEKFSFKAQIDEIEKRLKRDFEDAFNRLFQAHEGLKLIYGFDVNLPNKTSNPISDFSLWNRQAIEFLVAYQQLDQAFTRAISVRTLLSKDDWNALETKPVQFSLNSKLFIHHENVRFRGIGASIIGKAGLIPWSIKISLPKKAIYIRGGIPVHVDQNEFSSCLIGVVENRNSVRPMEYCGAVSLMNLSPIGDEEFNGKGLWEIILEKPEKFSEMFLDIDDIILEINVVAQPKSTF